MKITYIKELQDEKELFYEKKSKISNGIQKMNVCVRRKWGIGKRIKMKEEETLKILPYTIEELEDRKKWYYKQLEKEGDVILSKNLFQNKKLNIERKNVSIRNGKWMFFYLIIPTLEYVAQKLNKPIEEMNVAIVVYHVTEETIQMIVQLAEKVKNLSVITNQMARLRKTEEILYQERGIAIRLSNNKKKSLKKERLILNIDLQQEEMKQYEIHRKAMIINVKETIQDLPRRFLRN